MALFALFAIARITNMLLFYTVRTTAMEPTIHQDESIFLSKLVKPGRFDIIAIHRYDSLFGSVNWVYRVCGVPNDVIEIKNGVLYVNGANADSNLSLNQVYEVLKWQAESLKKGHEPVIPAMHPDSAVVSISDRVLIEKGIAGRRTILPVEQADPGIQRAYQQPWNQDHFGPVKVPPGKYFLLGDNRRGAMDSRYIGFVDNSSFRGTLIW